MSAVVELAISFGNADQDISFRISSNRDDSDWGISLSSGILKGFCDRKGIGEDGFGLGTVLKLASSFGNAAQETGFRGFLLKGFCDREDIGEDGFGLGTVVEFAGSFGNVA